MPDTNATDFFDILASVLIRCAIVGYLLLILSLAVYVLAGDTIYNLNAHFFNLSRHELDLFFYSFFVLTKFVVFLFFLLPWVAIRLVVRKLRKA